MKMKNDSTMSHSGTVSPQPAPHSSAVSPHPSPLLEREGTATVGEKKVFKEFSEYQWIDGDIMMFAKELRERQTPAEEFFWQFCRDRKIAWLKFRRQHPIGRSIVDFFCKELELVIELDWSVHNSPEAKINDKVRQKNIELQWKTVLRFTNQEVFDNIEKVIQTITSIKNTPPLFLGEPIFGMDKGQGVRSN